MRTAVVAAALLALLLSACSGAPDSVATNDIEPKVRVVSTAGEGTVVSVVLYRGDSFFATYRLLAGERLTATGPDGSVVELVRGVDTSAFLRRNAYVGTLPEVPPREDVIIAFERSGEASALETVVRIPGEIRVSRPQAGDRRTLNESFTVAWDALASDDVELSYRVPACDGLDAEELDELRTQRGFVSFLPIDGSTGLTTTSFDAPSAATRCEADLIVGRVGDQIALDPAFGELRDASRAVRVTAPIPMVFTETPSVATADIQPKVRVVSVAGGATEVTVVLFRTGVFTGTFELAIGERLTVTPAGGDTVALRPGVDASVVTEPDAYTATLPPLAPGTELVIALERPGDVSAPRTTVRIPDEIVVSEPAAATTVSFGEAFTVRWQSLASGQVELRYDLQRCDALDAEAFEDARAARARPLALRDGDAESTSVTFPRPDEAERCEADLLVGRTSTVIDLDPAFGGLAAASRAVRVTAPIPLVFVPSAP